MALSVADEGRGIPAERLPNLFRKFSRTEGEYGDREIGESGLGLAICKRIVDTHDGRIWAENEGSGLGGRFTFTLTTVEEAASAHSTDSAQTQSNAIKGGRILEVDDDPETLRFVRHTLTEASYEPTVEADVGEALDLMKENKPHLVLLDLILPGSDGIELMKDILLIGNVPVIFISVYGRDQVIARAFEAGASDCIVKPFSPTELVARVRASLRRRVEPHISEPPEPYVQGDLTIDYTGRRVMVGGNTVALTPIEYDVLYELSIHSGKVVRTRPPAAARVEPREAGRPADASHPRDETPP